MGMDFFDGGMGMDAKNHKEQTASLQLLTQSSARRVRGHKVVPFSFSFIEGARIVYSDDGLCKKGQRTIIGQRNVIRLCAHCRPAPKYFVSGCADPHRSLPPQLPVACPPSWLRGTTSPRAHGASGSPLPAGGCAHGGSNQSTTKMPRSVSRM